MVYLREKGADEAGLPEVHCIFQGDFEGGTVQCGIGDSERWTAGVMEMLRLCGE